jgi:ABC-type transporter Mla MlaB component
MRLTSEGTPDHAVVTAAGRLTASQAGRLHRLLIEAFERSGRVELSVHDVQEADLTFLQLLCSAHRTAAARGASFVLSGLETAEPVLRLIHEAGAERDAGCPEVCVWPDTAVARGDRSQG